MARYRQKPVVVEAEQFFWNDGESWPAGVVYVSPSPEKPKGTYIETLEGLMKVSEGDWIVTGANGEKYPWQADMFEATYELAPDGSMAERL